MLLTLPKVLLAQLTQLMKLTIQAPPMQLLLTLIQAPPLLLLAMLLKALTQVPQMLPTRRTWWQ